MPIIPKIDAHKNHVIASMQTYEHMDTRINMPGLATAKGAIDDIFSIFKKDAPKKEMTAPPRAGGYKGSGVDPEILAGAKAYADIARDVHKAGYNLIELPESEMVYRFGNREGYERGGDIYVAKGMSPAKKVKVAWHELEAKRLQKKTGRSHEELHPEIISRQDAGAQSYFSRAIRELFG
jgi:hypothetical protein